MIPISTAKKSLHLMAQTQLGFSLPALTVVHATLAHRNPATTSLVQTYGRLNRVEKRKIEATILCKHCNGCNGHLVGFKDGRNSHAPPNP